MPGGPQPMSREERLTLARDVAGRLLAVRDDVVAIGLYGSSARGDDGPYSDVEMLCVVGDGAEERDLEWSYGPGKAELNLVPITRELERAATVDVDWPLTHGAYVDVMPLAGDAATFDRLRDVALSQPDAKFDAAIKLVIVGGLYERIGKLRNAMRQGSGGEVPLLAGAMSREALCLVGLANQHLYGGMSGRVEASLRLPDLPAGYEAFARMMLEGDLRDRAAVAVRCEALFAGVERWAAARGTCIDEQRIPF